MLSNLLVLPQVDEDSRRLFYQMSINQNMKMQNFGIVSKIVSSYEKLIKTKSVKEKTKIEDIKVASL